MAAGIADKFFHDIQNHPIGTVLCCGSKWRCGQRGHSDFVDADAGFSLRDFKPVCHRAFNPEQLRAEQCLDVVRPADGNFWAQAVEISSGGGLHVILRQLDPAYFPDAVFRR